MTTILVKAGLTFPLIQDGMEDTVLAINQRLRTLDATHIDVEREDPNPFYPFIDQWISDGVQFPLRSDDLEQIIESTSFSRHNLITDEALAAYIVTGGDAIELPRYAQFGSESDLDNPVPENFPNRYQDPPTNSVPHTWHTWCAQAENITFPAEVDGKWYVALVDYSDPLRHWLKATAWWFEQGPDYVTFNQRDYIELTVTEEEPLI